MIHTYFWRPENIARSSHEPESRLFHLGVNPITPEGPDSPTPRRCRPRARSSADAPRRWFRVFQSIQVCFAGPYPVYTVRQVGGAALRPCSQVLRCSVHNFPFLLDPIGSSPSNNTCRSPGFALSVRERPLNGTGERVGARCHEERERSPRPFPRARCPGRAWWPRRFCVQSTMPRRSSSAPACAVRRTRHGPRCARGGRARRPG